MLHNDVITRYANTRYAIPRYANARYAIARYANPRHANPRYAIARYARNPLFDFYLSIMGGQPGPLYARNRTPGKQATTQQSHATPAIARYARNRTLRPQMHSTPAIALYARNRTPRK